LKQSSLGKSLWAQGVEAATYPNLPTGFCFIYSDNCRLCELQTTVPMTQAYPKPTKIEFYFKIARQKSQFLYNSSSGFHRPDGLPGYDKGKIEICRNHVLVPRKQSVV
jgi:hypothetical protein